MRRLVAALAAYAMLCSSAFAQANLPTQLNGQSVATGLTFQQIQSAQDRRSITIQNNNTNGDSCWIFLTNAAGQMVGGTTTTSSVITILGVSQNASKFAMLLGPGGSYVRYYPNIPRDQIFGTCTASGDSIYVDIQ